MQFPWKLAGWQQSAPVCPSPDAGSTAKWPGISNRTVDACASAPPAADSERRSTTQKRMLARPFRLANATTAWSSRLPRSAWPLTVLELMQPAIVLIPLRTVRHKLGRPIHRPDRLSVHEARFLSRTLHRICLILSGCVHNLHTLHLLVIDRRSLRSRERRTPGPSFAAKVLPRSEASGQYAPFGRAPETEASRISSAAAAGRLIRIDLSSLSCDLRGG